MKETTKNSTHSPEEILLHAVKKRRSASTGDIKNAVKLHSEEEDDHLSLEEETFPVDVDEEEEDERYSRRGFSHGCHLVKGQMGHGMEDYIVADTKTVKGHKLGLYAIFDGHSGRNVADSLQNHLFDNILNQPDRESDVVKQITVDHEPDKERDLVESKGGFISKKPGNVPRVDGQLAMTRAFGDERLKEYISVRPHIDIVEIHELDLG
ncbi:putative protein phosphatase 2C 28 [Cardamine amara subsp. amara]|uniref:PPM-type phosphatase domain-containing protein n=1 Tax=Cardamine amara subsp. amara TaxID=228776 RepID=A0ABD0Z0W9_CARAN